MTIADMLKTICLAGNTGYADVEDLDSYSSLNYGSWHEQSRKGTVELFFPSHLSGSDYSGSSLERSNYGVFVEEYAKTLGTLWFETPGSHGTFGVAIRMDCADVDILETLQALSDYPIMDEDHMSNLEMEEQNKQWESSDRYDFVRQLEKRSEMELDNVEVDDIDTLAHEAMQGLELYYQADGADHYIDVKALADAVPVQDIKALNGATPEYDEPDGETPTFGESGFVFFDVSYKEDDEGTHETLVGGILFGDVFVVHRAIGSESRSWNVTHRPSGLAAITGVDSRRKAEKMAHFLADTNNRFRWDFASTEDDLFKSQRNAMADFVRELRDSIA